MTHREHLEQIQRSISLFDKHTKRNPHNWQPLDRIGYEIEVALATGHETDALNYLAGLKAAKGTLGADIKERAQFALA